MKTRFCLSVLFSACLLTNSVFADEVIIKKNDLTITDKDLINYSLDRVPASRRAEFFAKPDSGQQLTESLLIIRALAKEAEKSGVVDTQLVDWQVNLHRDRLMMDQYLKALSEEKTRNINWEVTAKDVYKAEPESFTIPEQVSASHVLIHTKERDDEEALKLAKEVRQKLEQGADIKQLAEEYSDDPSAKANKGALGTFPRGQMVPEFEEAVFALRKPGEIAGPVKTAFGYHIILLESYEPAKKQAFDDVKDQIIASLKQEIPLKVRQDKIVETRSSPDIEVDDEKLQALLEKFRAGDFE